MVTLNVCENAILIQKYYILILGEFYKLKNC